MKKLNILVYLNLVGDGIHGTRVLGGIERATLDMISNSRHNFIVVETSPEKSLQRANDIIEAYTDDIDIVCTNVGTHVVIKKLTKFFSLKNVPVIFLNHVLLLFFEKMHIYADATRNGECWFDAFVREGNTVAQVSDFARRRSKDDYWVTSQDCQLFRPSYARPGLTYIKPKNRDIDLMTIARRDPIKSPYSMVAIGDYLGLSSRIYTNTIPDQKEYAFSKTYAEKMYLKFPKADLVYDLKHPDLFKEACNAKVFVSTCPVETFGIAAMEAGLIGLPSILLTDKHGDHASQEIFPDERFYRCVRKGDRKGFKKAFDELSVMTESERKEMSKLVADFNSKSKFFKTYDNLFQHALDHKKACLMKSNPLWNLIDHE